MTPDELRQLVAHVESQRTDRLATWRTLSEMFAPWRGQFSGERREGLRNKRLFNNVGARALTKAAAGLTEGMTPANLPWFRHDFRSADQRELTGARSYVDQIDERLGAGLAAGGFYPAIHTFNQDLLAFGAALLYCEPSRRTAVRFETINCGTYAVALDSEQDLSCVVCHRTYAVRDLIRRFGKDHVSRTVRDKDTRAPYEAVDVVHVVMRRDERDEERLDGKNMPIASYWYEARGGEDLLSEGGYHDMPYFYAVWNAGRGAYGTGPGDVALSDQRAVESYELYKSLGLEKTIDPPLNAPGSLKGRVSTLPGAINGVSGIMGSNKLEPLYQVNFGAAVQYVQQEIALISGRIDETMLATVFASIPLDQRPAGMSATEFLARRREAIQMAGPAISAYEARVLSRLLDRTYGIMDRAGLMPIPPDNLGGLAILDVDYLSPLSQALRQTGADTTRALVADVAGLAAVDPGVLDKLDTDQVVDELARGLGAPGSVVRSDEDVAALRQARADAHTTQQQAAREQAQLAQLAQVASVSTDNTVAGEVIRAEERS